MPSKIYLRIAIDSSALTVAVFRDHQGRSEQLSMRSQSIERVNQIYGWYRSISAQRSFTEESDAGLVSSLKALGEEVYSVFLGDVLQDVAQPDAELLVEHEAFLFPLELAYDGNEFLGLKYSVENRRVYPNKPYFDKEKISVGSNWEKLVNKNCLFIGSGDESVAHALPTCKVTNDYQDVMYWVQNRDVNVLHFSGHGVFNAKHPDDYFLALSDPWSKEQSLVSCRTLGDSWKENPPRLMFLNACSVGSWNKDQSFRALADVFDNIRVNKLIAPLWSIDDRVAAYFAERFYKRLFAGESASKALQSARQWCWNTGLLTSLSYILLGKSE